MLQNEKASFGELYQNKVLIIYNNVYTNDKTQKTCPIQAIGDFELNQAEVMHNISSYIIDDMTYPFSFDKVCQPINLGGFSMSKFENQELFMQYLKNNQSQSHTYLRNQLFLIENVYDSFCSCSDGPKVDDLVHICRDLSNEIKNIVFSHTHLVVHRFQPKMVQSGVFTKKFTLGQIYVKFSISKKTRLIANYQDPKQEQLARQPVTQPAEHIQVQIELNQQLIVDTDQQPLLQQKDTTYQTVNKLCALKLLNFEKKLNYLRKNITNSKNRPLIIQVIMAELLDEVLIYLDNTALNVPKTMQRMTSWEMFRQINFAELNAGAAADQQLFKQEMASFMCLLVAYLDLSLGCCGKLCCCSKTTQIKNNCSNLLIAILDRHYGLKKNQVSQQVEQVSKRYSENHEAIKKVILYPEQALTKNRIRYSNSSYYQVIAENQIPPFLQPEGQIAENQYAFTNLMNGERLEYQRQTKITEFENQIKYYFDLQA